MKEKTNNTRGKLRSIKDMFENYSESDIKQTFYLLTKEERSLLIKAFGNSLNSLEYYSNLTLIEKKQVTQIKQKMKRYLINPPKRKEKKSILTTSTINDMLKKISYKPLSKEREILFIKKAKLSYYYDSTEEEKKEYLDYYMEMFPNFRKKYEETSFENKQVILDEAIENSLYWRNKFIENNQRLVLKIAYNYKYNHSLEDLIIEGNIGLIKALQKFDLKKGCKFSTYAVTWIRKEIIKYIKNREKTIRVPNYIAEKANTINIAREKFQEKYYRNPTASELAQITEIDIKIILRIIKYELEMSDPLSLNFKIGEDQETEIENMIISEENPYETVENDIFYEEIMKIIENSNIDQRTLEILKMRYGLDNQIPKSYNFIADYFKITPKRVKEIELQGLKKLKKNIQLKRFYNDESIEETTDKVERFKGINKIVKINNLTQLELTIINMFYIENLSLKQISNILGISFNEIYNIKEIIDKKNPTLLNNKKIQ